MTTPDRPCVCRHSRDEHDEQGRCDECDCSGFVPDQASPYAVECPVCHVAPYERCRTLRTGRTTDTHMQRIAEHYKAAQRDPGLGVPD